MSKEKITFDDYKGREIPLLNFQEVNQFDCLPFDPYAENNRAHRTWRPGKGECPPYQSYKSSNLKPLRFYSDTRGDQWVTFTLPGGLQLIAPTSLRGRKGLRNNWVSLAEVFWQNHIYLGELHAWPNQFKRIKQVDRKNVPQKYLPTKSVEDTAKQEVKGLSWMLMEYLPDLDYDRIAEYRANERICEVFLKRVEFREFKGGPNSSATIDLKNRTMKLYDYKQLGCFNSIKVEF